IVEMPSMKAWAAMLYLAVFGSLLAYTAFVYLMHNVRPSLATSYAYVNPIVAVILGVTLGDETLTGAVFFALPLILASVALVATRPRMRSPRVTDPQPVDQAA
ncbi:MAG TPA: EamA family transporter, partial [Acidimicrobiia bacterium]|nr:EamA family transporter [Acidimicrobiia bacterium]